MRNQPKLSDDLYFIRPEGQPDAPVKIGRAVSPRSRAPQLQVGNPYRLQLWITLPGRGHEEAQWHALFAKQRLCGEWFAWSDDLYMATILARTGDAIDEIFDSLREQDK